MPIYGNLIGKEVYYPSSNGVYSTTDVAAPSTYVQNGLVLSLDAGNPLSYSGSGTVWYDLSPNGNNFNIVSGAWSNTNGGLMNFQGSYGCAKSNSDIPLTITNGVTYHVVTRNIKGTGDWRTLTRSYVNNHHVIIYYTSYNLGMYDNTSAGFVDSGYQQTSLPNYGTSNWISMYFTFPYGSSPYYNMSYNDTPGTIRASITSSNARYQNSFGSIGAYHNGNNTPSSAGQYWGDIAVFNVYNRILTSAELLQNFNVCRGRFGL